MIRRADWEARLNVFIQDNLGLPFIWGTRDCSSFVSHAIEAMCGHCPDLPTFDYNTKKEALAFSKVHNATEIFLTHDFSIVERKFQQRGDILSTHHDGFECLHLICGTYVVSADPNVGVVQVAMEKMLEWWPKAIIYRIPHEKVSG